MIVESLADQVLHKIEYTSELYHRLILVVAPSGAGKTAALQNVKKRIGAPLVNLNLELSINMLYLTERRRALQIQRLLGEIVNESDSDTILLDNIEILFDVSLKQDPLRLLQGLSRNKIIIVSWNGAIKNRYLTYAMSDHPEYRRYPASDLVVVTPALIEGHCEK